MFPYKVFTAIPLSVLSGVLDQSVSDREPQAGAMNRVNNVFNAGPDANYWIGIEAVWKHMMGNSRPLLR